MGKGCFWCSGVADLVCHVSFTKEALMVEDDSELFSLCCGCHEVSTAVTM
jgi:hypothetical protein